MRKVTSKHGNVGPNPIEDRNSSNRYRCNVCDFCNGIDGHRQMFKDREDLTGGYICNLCFTGSKGHTSYSQKEEDWYRDAVDQSRRSVDGLKDYDEMVEDLIDQLDRNQDY